MSVKCLLAELHLCDYLNISITLGLFKVLNYCTDATHK